ncbi:hypothetical protein DFJ58DRAFT_749768 [Suillus subalutaceus]|uniref:uncharacterized protein n=1 Tax=Suillus subalutaceus TaxID=48586 RepID=UPI001B860DC1|nr:uncharacterized protein DFJ58DRAFT_749768 [Suillus subalutaceus]KAG1836585.1 hypothetical protein DFJ58DRAFT_749768 [Suillus subalutaceus]
MPFREANIKAAIQAVREKRAKNLSAAAGQFKRAIPYPSSTCTEPYETSFKGPQIPKRDRRAEQERSQAAFTGTIKTKKLEELRDLAAALRLPETGLKAEVFQRILQHFDGNTDLKTIHGMRVYSTLPVLAGGRLDNGDNTAELPQDAIPPSNPVREPFGYQPQPAPQPSMSRNEFPPPGYAPLHYPMQHPAPQPQHISHPHFAPASRSSADFRFLYPQDTMTPALAMLEKGVNAIREKLVWLCKEIDDNVDVDALRDPTIVFRIRKEDIVAQIAGAMHEIAYRRYSAWYNKALKVAKDDQSM